MLNAVFWTTWSLTPGLNSAKDMFLPTTGTSLSGGTTELEQAAKPGSIQHPVPGIRLESWCMLAALPRRRV